MLQAHVESQERPIYALVLERSDKQLGPQIHPTRADIDCKPENTCGSTSANTNGIVSGSITGTARSMAEIAQGFSPYAERRVFDRTGLEGRFDFDLQWSDIPLFTAVREQLGLKFEPARGPVDVVVIDHVERPTPD
jgi:bla regulator protein BlaR1